MTGKQVVIIGGSGFVGRYVVRELARAGWRIRVVCRHPAAAEYLKTAGDPGQIVPCYGDLSRPDTVLHYIPEADAVINLTGILFERGRQKFTALHAAGAEKIAQAAKLAHVPVLVQMSALGVNRATTSLYAHSKLMGEQAVRAVFPDAAIVRPGVIFGPDDGFLNRFGHLAALFGALPAIGGGKAKVQPVYVADVAKAIRLCVENPVTRGNVYELGGPEVYSWRQVLAYILAQTGHHRLLPLPFALARTMGFFTEYLPVPSLLKLTRDQVRLLQYDNTVEPGAPTLSTLGITPTALELVAPQVLSRFRRPGLAYA